MCLLPLEGLPLSHFSETIRVSWAVDDTVRADVGVPRVRGSTVQPLLGGEVALLAARFLFSHFSYQGCTSGPVRPVQAGSGHNSRIPMQLKKNDVVPTSSQDEALALYSVSRWRREEGGGS